MTHPTPIVERLREFADPDGRIAFPIVDQDGKQFGVARRTPEEMTRSEAYVDDRGTAWMPPTAWAYMAVCAARDAKQATIEHLERTNRELSEALRECADKLWVLRCNSRDDKDRAAAEYAFDMATPAPSKSREDRS